MVMNRPEAHNAMSPELIDQLDEAIAAIDGNADVRVMILAGEGRSFCAGMDLKGVIADPPAMGKMLHGFSVVLRRIRRLAIPTIARVQGAAVGGGCGLMIVPDFAITHPEAKVGFPEVDLGVCPAVVAPWVIRKLGAGPGRAMLLAGGTMSGEAGLKAGLASHLASRESLESAAMELATKLLKGGRNAMAATKRWLNELDGSMQEADFDRAAAISAEVIAGAEAQAKLRKVLGIS